MNNGFFPDENYKMPSTSNYMKFIDGDNKFRVLSSAIIGYEYWNRENKPIRSRAPFDETPDAKTEKDGSVRVNHFWAFVVWNYNEEKVQILELTQKSIMKFIQAHVKNEKWGDPKGYDIVVNRVGSGFDTEYTISADPHSPVPAEATESLSKKKIQLDALYSGADPFTSQQ